MGDFIAMAVFTMDLELIRGSASKCGSANISIATCCWLVKGSGDRLCIL